MMEFIRRWLEPVSASRVTRFILFSAIFNFSLFGISDVLTNFYYTSLGHSVETIGILQSLPRISGVLVSLPVGFIATRIGTYRVLIYATIGIIVMMFLPIAVPALPSLALSCFLMGLFYGAQQVAFNPFLGALVKAEHHAVLFSYHNVIAMLAASLGSFVGGFLPTLAARLLVLPPPLEVAARSTIAYAAVLLLSVLVGATSLLLLIRLPQSPVAQATARIRLPMRDFPWKRLLLMAIPMLFFGFTGGLTFPFYNLFFRQTFHVADDVVGSILSIGWLGMGFLPLINPSLDRRFGRTAALFMMLVVSAAAYFGLSIAPTLPLSIIAFVIAVSARGTMQPLFQPLIMANLPVNVHNMASSIGFVAWNIGWFAATSVGGFLQAAQGYDFMMQVVAVGVLLTGVSVLLVFRRPMPVIAEPRSNEAQV
jgi:MFS family permease